MTLDSDMANDPFRLAVVAPALRSAGGLAVGRNLIEALISVAPNTDFCFIVPSGVGYEAICSRARNARIFPTAAMGAFERLRFDTLRIPEILESFSPDVVLALDSSHAVRNPRWPQAIFVQDAHPLYPSSQYGPRTLKARVRNAYLNWHFRRSLVGTGLVFVQTEVMAARLRSAFAFSGVTSVCGTAVSTSLLRSHSKPSELPNELRPYANRFKLLCVAHYAPHKGIERIVDVFDRFRDELSEAVVFLTITPHQHRNVTRILKRIEKLNLAKQIVNLGEVPREKLGAYYRSCDAMLLPTTLESFGVTYVEALACHLPILTSDLDFARETCSDAALYFDPWKLSEIKDAIVHLYRNPDLREQLSSEGRNKAQVMHTWNEIAASVISALTDLAGLDHTKQDPKS